MLRQWLALVLAILIFIHAAIYGPLQQLSVVECGFTLCLMAGTAIALSLLSRRPALSISLTAVLFEALQFAAATKYEHLRDPLLITDILYFSNFGIVDTLRQYPEISDAAPYVAIGFRSCYCCSIMPISGCFAAQDPCRELAGKSVAFCLPWLCLVGLTPRAFHLPVLLARICGVR
ncbi:MAG: hypothetical protein ABI411_17240 [Tahibacter sp.]